MDNKLFTKRSSAFKHAMALGTGFATRKEKREESGSTHWVEHPLGKSYVAGYVGKKRVGVSVSYESGNATATWVIHRGRRAEPIKFQGPSPEAFEAEKVRAVLARAAKHPIPVESNEEARPTAPPKRLRL